MFLVCARNTFNLSWSLPFLCLLKRCAFSLLKKVQGGAGDIEDKKARDKCYLRTCRQIFWSKVCPPGLRVSPTPYMTVLLPIIPLKLLLEINVPEIQLVAWLLHYYFNIHRNRIKRPIMSQNIITIGKMILQCQLKFD